MASGNDLLDSERRARDTWLARRLALLSADERARLVAVVPILDRTEPKEGHTVTVAMEAVYTGDVVNYHDQRPEEPGDAQNEPLNPER